MVYPPVTQFETRALRVAETLPLRVVVGEDSVLLRAGTVRVLEDAGFEVVGQAGDPTEWLRKVRAHRPDVAVLNLNERSLSAATAIRAELPAVGLVALASDGRFASQFLADGSEGVAYLLEVDVDRLTDAITRVARGASVLDPEVVTAMVNRRRRRTHPLTEREYAVLDEMAEGKSNRAIAEALYASERAVERHISAIFAKLSIPSGEDVHRRVLAVLRAVAS